MVVDINYANKGSHALQAHCQTQVHNKKVQMIASTHSGARILPASARVESCKPESSQPGARNNQAAVPGKDPHTSYEPHSKRRGRWCRPVSQHRQHRQSIEIVIFIILIIIITIIYYYYSQSAPVTGSIIT